MTSPDNPLEVASLLYREPALYAAMTDDGAIDTAAAIIALADRYGPTDAQSALDIGCGTGAVLEHLATLYPVATGVDLLPGMVETADAQRSWLDVRVGDMRTVRLDRRFDLVVCVGNSLAYLTTVDDIAAAFVTFAEHCARGGLLILQTLTTWPFLDRPRASRASLAGRDATVTVTYTRDPSDETLIMTRCWQFDDGELATDTIRRRILPADEQEAFASAVGLVPASQEGLLPQAMTVYTRKDKRVLHREAANG